uniref:Uncharacterized protein n=1 Tax=Dulem virus 42 TaxID=3145760 RepID=A0AAU8B9I4_9CAUD
MNLSKVDIHDIHSVIEPFDYITTIRNSELIGWVMWVNKNICQKLETDYFETTGVKIRIATGMLNNIQSLSDLQKIQIHSNIVRNIYLEIGRIQEESLPF